MLAKKAIQCACLPPRFLPWRISSSLFPALAKPSPPSSHHHQASDLGISLLEEQAPDAGLTPEEIAAAAAEQGEGGSELQGEQLDKFRRGLEDLFNMY